MWYFALLEFSLPLTFALTFRAVAWCAGKRLVFSLLALSRSAVVVRWLVVLVQYHNLIAVREGIVKVLFVLLKHDEGVDWF